MGHTLIDTSNGGDALFLQICYLAALEKEEWDSVS